jgi:hypothetical protein
MRQCSTAALPVPTDAAVGIGPAGANCTGASSVLGNAALRAIATITAADTAAVTATAAASPDDVSPLRQRCCCWHCPAPKYVSG